MKQKNAHCMLLGGQLLIKAMPLIKPTPWDTAIFGMPTWELTGYSEDALKQAVQEAGHYTVKVEPLASKRLLHEYGFYYCDTLIEPYCSVARFCAVQHPDATISNEFDADKVLVICHGAFSHGRFHRDFNLPKAKADLRYDNWLKQLIEAEQVYGLFWQGELAGFIAYNGNSLVLHALSEEYRGMGLSKYWWSEVCCELFENGHDQVKSSISVTNLAIFKLYASLGFSFTNSQDVYHSLVL